MKTISFAVPCYNSAEYMEKCVNSLLPYGDDVEILLVDDGSTKDNTLEVAQRLEAEHPGVVRAIHQENKGHGGAVNTGLENATGLYFKVVDSDDWLDESAMKTIMEYLRSQVDKPYPTDLVISNYVYEKVYESTSTTIRYTNVFPVGREFTWDEIGHFHSSQYLLMHSVIYRTEMLRETGLKLPEHCFYVDNIFVYVPLPMVKSAIYFDVDTYRYFIGREDQSVNESVMLSRIDQQIRITKFMIDAVDLSTVEPQKLSHYMRNYLTMMMTICSVFLRMETNPETDAKRAEIWAYLWKKDPALCKRIRRSFLAAGVNLPTALGRAAGLGGYRLAQKIFKFN